MKTRHLLFGNLLGSVVLCLVIGIPYSLCAGGVSAYWIDSSEDLLSGQYADGQLSDLMLENDEIAVVISALGHTVYYAESGGNIIDAGSAIAREDALSEFYTYFDDDWPRQAVYTTLDIIDDGSGGGPAVVRATGLDSDDPALTVVTDYQLGADDNFVTLTTEITNTGATTYAGFEVGDAFAWGGCQKFAPGYGFEVYGTTAETWLAGTAGNISYGYCGSNGTIWGPHGSGWSDLNDTALLLWPGESGLHTRYFVVGDGDIASVATIVHEIKGSSVGEVTCTVANQSTGSPIPNVEIDVYDSYDHFYAQMVTDSGGASYTTLLADSWRLIVTRSGFWPEEIWVSLGAGDSALVEFELRRDTEHTGFGDTLTVIQRPLINIPVIVAPGDTFPIECEADPATTGWAAELIYKDVTIPLDLLDSTYDPSTLWWTLSVSVPAVPLYELYDLHVTADGGIDDVTWNAVRAIPQFKDDYYFVHITDTHLPTHMFHQEQGASEDSSEMEDLRAVITDINLINPEFVLLTGDLVNEGELEAYLGWHVFTKSQRILKEFEVPVYLIAGNHDIGGWDSTPPPDGTSRRDWWRFFGWKRLNDPPPGAPWYTQNYSFDYGPIHFIALEAYDNYDGWKYNIYGSESFTSGQLQWLDQELLASSGSLSQVLFYHYDFSNQINLNALGVDMALWGHIHSNQGSIHNHPYNLATNNVCDGDRTYRLIRVSNGVLDPSGPVSAGLSGDQLNVQYTPANDGTNYEVSAQIYNSLTKQFEHAQLKFLMPKTAGDVSITGGTLNQIDTSDSIDVYYVDVVIQPNSVKAVTITLDPSAVDEPSGIEPKTMSSLKSYPNPFNPDVDLSFTLSKAGPVNLSVFDISGREVSVLVDGFVDAGRHSIRWDGTDRLGKPMPSGVYVVRLDTGSAIETTKAVLAR